MNPVMRKVFPVILVLAASVASTLAADCDFRFTRDLSGDLTHFEVAGVVSTLEITSNSTWNTYVKKGETVTIGDQTGKSTSHSMDSLPEDQRKHIEELFGVDLRIYEINGVSGHVSVDARGPAYLVSKKEKNGSISIKGINLFGNVFAGETKSGYTHAFLQNSEIVSLVSKSCDGVVISALADVDETIRKSLIDGSENFDKKRRN